MPPFINFLSAHTVAISVTQISLMALVYFAMLIYICGPRGLPWLAPTLKPLTDRLNSRLPWRRKRLQRDFSAMLAQLLDAGMPEYEALTLAARSTDNCVFEGHSLTATARLRTGIGLTNAVEVFDNTGEFRWRLTNAAQGQSGFLTALAGWHDTLDAQAYQAEQVASQIITTGIVIINGCVIGLIAIGMFQVLTSVVVELSIW